MGEIFLLLQALLLIAGWILFLRAQTELRAQAARQSLTGEMEELRRSVEALLHRLTSDAAAVEQRLQSQIADLEKLLETLERNRNSDGDVEKPTGAHETFEPLLQYKHSEEGRPLTALTGSGQGSYDHVQRLASQGLAIQEIARQTGFAPGEVELILNLAKNRTTEEA